MSRLAWVDVFAPRPMSGNPLGVVLDAEKWPEERMQGLAAELGLSETAFVLPPEDERHAARLRIFTPARELPMAGHPVIGAAWVLATSGRMPSRALLETGVGPLEVRVSGTVATMTQTTPQAGPVVDPTPVAQACGLEAADSPPAQVWSTGLPQLMVPVPSVEALAAARPDAEALAALGEAGGWVGVSFYAVEGTRASGVEARVRHFAPGAGVLEEPGTGSAAGALGACLAEAGFGRDSALQLVVRQGIEMGRPGEIAVRVDQPDGGPPRVQVGGRVIAIFQGRLALA